MASASLPLNLSDGSTGATCHHTEMEVEWETRPSWMKVRASSASGERAGICVAASGDRVWSPDAGSSTAASKRACRRSGKRVRQVTPPKFIRRARSWTSA